MLVRNHVTSKTLERFIVDQCCRSLHMALKVCWQLLSWHDELDVTVTTRARDLYELCETAAVNGTRDQALVTITDEALEQLKQILSEEEGTNLALRIFVQGSRAAMTLDDTEREGDVVMDFDGMRVLVDDESAPYLAGAVISYQNTLMERGFVIENANLPQSGGGCCGGSCGCGGH